MSLFQSLLAAQSRWDNNFNTNFSGQQVWGIIGDSIGRGRNDEDGDIGPHSIYASTVYQFRPGTGIVDLQDLDLQGANDGSQWKKWAMDYYKYTQYKPVIAAGAVGSASFYPRSGFGTNNWSASGVNRGDFETLVTSALSATGTTRLRGAFLVLGINDAIGSESLASIETEVDNLFAWFFSTYPNVPLYVWNIGYDAGVATSRVTSIRGYIQNAVNDYPNEAFMVLELEDYLDYHGVDGIHLTQFGNDLTGAQTTQTMRQQFLMANRPLPYSFSAGAQAVINAFPTALTEDEKKIVSDTYEYHAGFSIWTTYDRFCIMTFNDASNSLHDWVGSNEFTGNSINHSVLGNETTGVSTSYINTNFDPAADGSAWTTNSCHAVLIVVKNLHPASTVGIYLGAIGTTANQRVQLSNNASTGLTYRINDGNSPGSFGTGTFANGGYYKAIRLSGSSSGMYENITSILGSSGTAVANTTVDIYVGVRNNNDSTRDFPVNTHFGAVTFGSGAIPHTGVMRALRNVVVSLMVI